jgi:hypothetical protein
MLATIFFPNKLLFLLILATVSILLNIYYKYWCIRKVKSISKKVCQKCLSIIGNQDLINSSDLIWNVLNEENKANYFQIFKALVITDKNQTRQLEIVLDNTIKNFVFSEKVYNCVLTQKESIALIKRKNFFQAHCLLGNDSDTSSETRLVLFFKIGDFFSEIFPKKW